VFRCTGNLLISDVVRVGGEMTVSEAMPEVRTPRSTVVGRPMVRGKYLFVGAEKFWVRGISYGTFYMDENRQERLTPEVVERDFSQMAAHGFNVVRVYTAPPRWLLDAAMEHGLRVMIGLNWGEHMAFLGEPRRIKEIEGRVRTWVRSCSGHPAVFCYIIGNEIPASIVRWHGRHRVEKFIEGLYRIAKEEDPDALVTYVNYPSTEYLRLPFLDFLCFNVYLESRDSFEDYLSRLHSLSEDLPVMLTEIGLDSLRGGEQRQATVLESQVRAAFLLGCAGVVIFAWTDEWYHGKYRVEDWAFGLTTLDRTPKLALRAVSKAFAEAPFPPGLQWPKISVVVCTYNGASTIRDTLEALRDLDYPDFEVIVVNDGSTDGTAQIISDYPYRVIHEENQGLSRARNTGIAAATGEIVAFIDDDAYPDPDWLRFLARSFMDANVAAVGGPNLAPPNDGWRADAIANAPGGPNAVLLTDRIAEHIPGCNMAFRKGSLEAIGRFDPVFRTAGDDVDICWRLRDRGEVIGYSAAAVVWHHRRRAFRTYWKQQVGYGKAEALLEKKWPSRYDSLGRLSWLGRIYGKGVSHDLSSLGGRVYQGVWGTAPFQSLYQRIHSRWSWALMPEWYLLVAILSGMFLLSLGWEAAFVLGPCLLLSVAVPVAQAAISAARARFVGFRATSRWSLLGLRTVVLILHLSQPMARLVGRIKGGLAPWRRRGPKTRPRFRPLQMTYWRDEREPPEDTLRALQKDLQTAGTIVRVGGEFDAWDLEVLGGPFGRSQLLLAVEDHAPRKQLLRFRISPKVSRWAIGLCAVFGALAVGALRSGVWVSSIVAAVVAGFVAARTLADSGLSAGILREWVRRIGAAEQAPSTTGEARDEIKSTHEPPRPREPQKEALE
jgi:glycosyltransferase involved in cell wall biosynthesis